LEWKKGKKETTNLNNSNVLLNKMFKCVRGMIGNVGLKCIIHEVRDENFQLSSKSER